jgi:hypothetical protein
MRKQEHMKFVSFCVVESEQRYILHIPSQSSSFVIMKARSESCIIELRFLECCRQPDPKLEFLPLHGMSVMPS